MRADRGLCMLVCPFLLYGCTRSNAMPRTSARYTVTNLGTLPNFPGVVATGINNRGQVVGRVYNLVSQGHSFLWNGGGIADLGPVGTPDSKAYGINDNGNVVGGGYISTHTSHAYVYMNGKLKELSATGSPASIAYAIGSHDEMVGDQHLALRGRAQHATLWVGGTKTDLGTLGGTISRALAINQLGHIVGAADTAKKGVTEAFFWSGGKMTALAVPPTCKSAQANAINNRDEIVGYITDSQGHCKAAYWHSGKSLELGGLGGVSSEAKGINDKGQIVGWAEGTDGRRRAFLYENGKMEDLNDSIAPGSDWVLRNANAINEQGQIAGGGLLQDDCRAFILRPIGNVSA